MCNRAISENPLRLAYCPKRYKTKKIHDDAAVDCLAVLKFIADWFVSNKMIKKLLNNNYILNKILVMSYFLVMKLVFLV